MTPLAISSQIIFAILNHTKLLPLYHQENHLYWKSILHHNDVMIWSEFWYRSLYFSVSLINQSSNHLFHTIFLAESIIFARDIVDKGNSLRLYSQTQRVFYIFFNQTKSLYLIYLLISFFCFYRSIVSVGSDHNQIIALLLTHGVGIDNLLMS